MISVCIHVFAMLFSEHASLGFTFFGLFPLQIAKHLAGRPRMAIGMLIVINMMPYGCVRVSKASV